MGLLGRLFGTGSGGSGGGGGGEHDPEAIAQAIVGRYSQRRARGELRVDDWLIIELRQVLPSDKASEVFDRFRTRRSRSDPKAEYLLVMDIGIALHDTEYYAQNFKPMIVQRKPEVPDRTRPSAAKTYAKVLNGQPLTSADEDAVLFDDLLKDN